MAQRKGTPPGRAGQGKASTKGRATGDGRAHGSGGLGGSGAAGAGRVARVKFDRIDLAILDQLQRDSKITNATLAQRVGISPPSMIERVKKLEQSGIIRGYVALLDPVLVGKSICAIVHVTLRAHGVGELEKFKKAILGFEEIQDAWHTAGEEDFILKVLVNDMDHYEQFVVHRLSAAPNIGRVHTSFCLSTVKDETRVELDAVGGDGATSD